MFSTTSLHCHCSLSVYRDDLLNSMDHGIFTGVVYLDLKKVFAIVDHKIILSKLKAAGVSGIALSWFQSYLASRCQKTSVVDLFQTTRDCGCAPGVHLRTLIVFDVHQWSPQVLTVYVYCTRATLEAGNNFSHLNVSRWGSPPNRLKFEPKFNYREVPKLTKISSLLRSLLSEGPYFRVAKTHAVHGPFDVKVMMSRQMWKHPHF